MRWESWTGVVLAAVVVAICAAVVVQRWRDRRWPARRTAFVEGRWRRWPDEDAFRAFVKHGRRAPEEYAVWRLSGVPTAWLRRSGYAAGRVRGRRGPLP